MSFIDYVTVEQIQRFKYSRDLSKFILEFAPQKIEPANAVEMAWQFAEHGSILGAMRPDTIRAMFEHTHMARDETSWEFARAAGVDLPAKQDRLIYEEVEKCENDLFMEYCRECCPSLVAVLAR